MSNGWEHSAGPWISKMGERGDWGREHVLDPVLLERVSARQFARALDVGCGEGRFCRMLKARHITVVGIDPTQALLAQASKRDPSGDYLLARAEALPFADAGFDLVISYLTLIDIADFRAALRELARVLKPGGILLIANLNSFITSCPTGWIMDSDGRYLHYAVDRYLDEFSEWVEWSDIRLQQLHRAPTTSMGYLLSLGDALRRRRAPHPR